MIDIADVGIEYVLQPDGFAGIHAPAELTVIEHEFIAVEFEIGNRFDLSGPVPLLRTDTSIQCKQLLLAGDGALSLTGCVIAVARHFDEYFPGRAAEDLFDLAYEFDGTPDRALDRGRAIQIVHRLIGHLATGRIFGVVAIDLILKAVLRRKQLHEVFARCAHRLNDRHQLSVFIGAARTYDPVEQHCGQPAPLGIIEPFQPLDLLVREDAAVCFADAPFQPALVGDQRDPYDDLLAHFTMRLHLLPQEAQIVPRRKGGFEIPVKSAEHFRRTVCRQQSVPNEQGETGFQRHLLMLFGVRVDQTARRIVFDALNAKIVQFIEKRKFAVQQRRRGEHVLSDQIGALIGHAADKPLFRCVCVDRLLKIPGRDADALVSGAADRPGKLTLCVQRSDIVGNTERHQSDDLFRDRTAALLLPQERKILFGIGEDGSEFLQMDLIGNDAVCVGDLLGQKLPALHLRQHGFIRDPHFFFQESIKLVSLALCKPLLPVHADISRIVVLFCAAAEHIGIFGRTMFPDILLQPLQIGGVLFIDPDLGKGNEALLAHNPAQDRPIIDRLQQTDKLRLIRTDGDLDRRQIALIKARLFKREALDLKVLVGRIEFFQRYAAARDRLDERKKGFFFSRFQTKRELFLPVPLASPACTQKRQSFVQPIQCERRHIPIAQKGIDLKKCLAHKFRVARLEGLRFKQKVPAVFYDVVDREIEKPDVPDLPLQKRGTQVIDGRVCRKIRFIPKIGIRKQGVCRFERPVLIRKKQRAVVQPEKEKRIHLCDLLRKETLQKQNALTRPRRSSACSPERTPVCGALRLVKEVAPPEISARPNQAVILVCHRPPDGIRADVQPDIIIFLHVPLDNSFFLLYNECT